MKSRKASCARARRGGTARVEGTWWRADRRSKTTTQSLDLDCLEPDGHCNVSRCSSEVFCVVKTVKKSRIINVRSYTCEERGRISVVRQVA